MIKLAANLTMLFNEVPFSDRFNLASRAGFKAVEFLFPYSESPEELVRRLRDSKVEVVLFNLPAGEWTRGERGLAALPGRETEFKESLSKAVEYARPLGCPRLHAMSGIPDKKISAKECREVLISNMRSAASMLNRFGITLLIEPLNSRDFPGYYLREQAQAISILDDVGASNAFLQMDLYHCQIMEGDLSTQIRRNIKRIRHFQIAGVPDRNEPDIGEINYPFLLSLIDSLGYSGWVGCEYKPRYATALGLSWAKPYGIFAGEL